jgi:hypothetical protein
MSKGKSITPASSKVVANGLTAKVPIALQKTDEHGFKIYYESLGSIRRRKSQSPIDCPESSFDYTASIAPQQGFVQFQLRNFQKHIWGL